MVPPNADDRAVRWQISFPESLATRSWGTDVVLHDGATRSVHRLDAFSAAVLDVLKAGPADVAALTNDLAARFDLDRADLPEQVERVCRELGRRQLIEPSRP